MYFRWYTQLSFVLMITFLAWISLPGERERGILVARSGHCQEGRKLLHKTLENHPGDWLTLKSLVDLNRKCGHLPDSIEPLKTYLNLKPQDRSALDLLTTTLVESYRLDEAIALLRVRPKQDNKQLNLLLGLYIQTGQLKQAILLAEGQLNGNRSDLPWLRRILQYEQWQRNMDGVTKTLTRLATLDPSPQTWMELLNLHAWRWNPQGAALAAARVESFKECTPDTLRAVRYTYLRLRRADDAIRVGQRITQQKDAVLDDWLTLAQFEDWQGLPQASLASLNTAEQLYPDALPILLRQRELTGRLKDWAAHANISRRVASLTSSEADWRLVASALANSGNLKDALAVLKQQTGVAEGSTRWLAASLALKVGDRASAEIFTNSLVLLTQAPDATGEQFELAADLLQALGEKEKALAIIETGAGRFPDNQNILSLLVTLNGNLRKMAAGKAALASIEKGGGISEDDLRELKTDFWLSLVQTVAPTDPRRAEVVLNAIPLIQTERAKSQNTESTILLAELFLETRRLTDAVKLLSETSQETGEVTPQRIALAHALARAGQKQDARKILSLLPKNMDIEISLLPDLADVYTQLGEHLIAATLLERALRQGTKNRERHYTLADAYGSAGNRKRQYAIVDRLAEEGGESDWLAAADRRRWADDYDSEERVLARALTQHGNSFELMARRVQVLATLKRYQESLDLYTRMKKQGWNRDTKTAKAVASAMQNLGEVQESQALFAWVLETKPKDPEARLGLARSFLLQDQIRPAIPHFKAYLEEEATDGWAWYELATCFDKMNEPADDAYRRAKTFLLKEKIPGAAIVVAQITFRLGDVEEAVTLATAVSQREDALADVLCDCVDLLVQAKQVPRANRLLTQTAKRFPDHSRSRLMLAQLYIDTGHLSDAYAILIKAKNEAIPQRIALAQALALDKQGSLARKVLSTLPMPTTIASSHLIDLAAVYTELGEHQTATTLLERLITEGSHTHDLLIRLADAYGNMDNRERQYAIMDRLADQGTEADWIAAADRRRWIGDYASEDRVLKRALARHEGSLILMARRIQVLSTLNRHRESRDLYTQMKKQGWIRDIPTAKAVAFAMQNLGEFRESQNLFTWVLETKPDDLDARLSLARIFLLQEKFRTAIPHFNTYLEHEAKEGWAWYDLAVCLDAINLPATRAYRQAKTYLGEDQTIDATAAVTRITLRLGRIDEAFAMATSLSRRNDAKADVLCDCADLFVQVKQILRARMLLTQTAKRFPTHRRTQHMLAVAFELGHDNREAAARFRSLASQYPQETVYLQGLARTQSAQGHWQEELFALRRGVALSEGGGQR